MKNHTLATAAFGLLTAGIAYAVADSPSAKLTVVSKGAMAKAGYYMPQRILLTADKPAGIKAEPSYTNKPLYGTLKFGVSEDNGLNLALDEAPDASIAKLFLDSNADGDLTNDVTAEWTRRANKVKNPQTMAEVEMVTFSGSAEIRPKGEPAASVPYSVSFYRFAPAQAKLRNLPENLLFYYRDYAREGKLQLGDKTYGILLLDEVTAGRFDQYTHEERQPKKVSLLIDRNGDGKYIRQEQYDLAQPFTIGGTTYEVDKVAADGSSISLKVSAKKVAEIPMPADLSIGRPALAFTAPLMGASTVNFPQDFRGKLVLLDFWATWCGPCIREIPELVKAYEKYKDQGFDILGISLDQANQGEKVASFVRENKMPWRQVYDGKYWQAEIAQLYTVDSIPRAYLIDGNTGKIIASGNSLRGEALDATIAKALEQLKGGG